MFEILDICIMREILHAATTAIVRIHSTLTGSNTCKRSHQMISDRLVYTYHSTNISEGLKEPTILASMFHL